MQPSSARVAKSSGMAVFSLDFAAAARAPYMDSSCNARKKRRMKQEEEVRLRPYIRPLSGVLLHAGPRWTSRGKGESTYRPRRPLGCATHLPPVLPFFPSFLLPDNRQRTPFGSTTQQLLTPCVAQRAALQRPNSRVRCHRRLPWSIASRQCACSCWPEQRQQCSCAADRLRRLPSGSWDRPCCRQCVRPHGLH